MKEQIKRVKKEAKNIFRMIKNRDFQGYTGLAVKNSTYQFGTTLVAKIGSLLFTIIIARLLMPELFGLYSLALSTILLFETFTNLGVAPTLIRFVSKSLGEKNYSEAKTYTIYLAKIKIILYICTSILLIFLARFIAESYYQKPIFFALLAGVFYLCFNGIVGFIGFLFQSANQFKQPLLKEILLQTTRIIVVPLAVLFALNQSLSSQKITFVMIMALSFVYFISSIFYLYSAKKKLLFLQAKTKKLNRIKTKQVHVFFSALSVSAISGFFFAYVDTLMLGHYVSSEFIGYYQAAFSLIGALMSLLIFSVVLFPLFSRIKGKQLERGFNKSKKITFILSLFLLVFILIFAKYIILIIFGREFLAATNILRLMALLVISFPLTSIYSSYIIAKDRPELITKIVIVASIINIILNYFFITYLLNYGELQAVFGAAVATIISRYFYLAGLIVMKKRIKN